MTSGSGNQPATPVRYRPGRVVRRRLKTALVLPAVLCIAWMGMSWYTHRSAASTLAEVQTQLSRGETDSARVRLERILWFDPDHPEALLLLARTHYSDGDYPQTLETLARLPADTAPPRQAGMLKADACLALADLHRAEQALVEQVRRFPADQRAVSELRWLYFNQFRRRDVERLLSAQLAASPGRVDVVIDLLMSEFRGPVVREGVGYLEQVNAVRPDQPEVLSALGYCYGQLGDPDRGIEMLRESLQIDAGNELTRLRAAALCLERGDSRTARKHLSPVTGASADDDRVLWLLARCAEQERDLESALALIERALSLRPFELEYVQHRGRYLQQLGRVALAEQAFLRSRDLGACELRLTEIVWSGALQQPDATLAREIAGLCRQRGRELEAEAWDTLSGRLSMEQR